MASKSMDARAGVKSKAPIRWTFLQATGNTLKELDGFQIGGGQFLLYTRDNSSVLQWMMALAMSREHSFQICCSASVFTRNLPELT